MLSLMLPAFSLLDIQLQPAQQRVTIAATMAFRWMPTIYITVQAPEPLLQCPQSVRLHAPRCQKALTMYVHQDLVLLWTLATIAAPIRSEAMLTPFISVKVPPLQVLYIVRMVATLPLQGRMITANKCGTVTLILIVLFVKYCQLWWLKYNLSPNCYLLGSQSSSWCFDDSTWDYWPPVVEKARWFQFQI